MSQWTPSNCITYWFPKLVESGVRVPNTHILHATCELVRLLDGRKPIGFDNFIALCEVAAINVEFPCFFRMGHGSGKHDWSDCCWIEHISQIAQRIASTVEDQALKDLETCVVVFREAIPTKPLFHAFHGRMPISREFRFFVDVKEVWPEPEPIAFKPEFAFKGFPTYEHSISHVQPYWPADAIEGQKPTDPGWRNALKAVSTLSKAEYETLSGLVLQAAKYFEQESWTFDVLQDRHGKWWFTDMALAGNSCRWEPDFDVIRD